MARTKAFDPLTALKAALKVFWEKGYEVTTTDDLLIAMKINRQSLYDTFGDKRRLFLAVLDYYASSSGAELKDRLTSGPSPLAALDAFLQEVAGAGIKPSQLARGCLAVNAIAAFGKTDPDVYAIVERSQRMTEESIAEALENAQQVGELHSSTDSVAAAHFVHSAIRGMRISAKAGASSMQLSETAEFVMAALKRPVVATRAGRR